MTLVLIGLVGGIITGLSPCVLPVLPVVFLGGGAPRRSLARCSDRRRPYLIVAGLTLGFAVFTLFGSWILASLHLPDDAIRWAGLVLLVLVGLGLLVPSIGHLLERPFYRFPQRLAGTGGNGFVLGIALGAVFVPCAGPVLAAITVAGATDHIGLRTIGLTLGFAVGTAIPLLAFALAGRRLTSGSGAFRRHQGAFRAASGVVMIVLAVALTFNLSDIIQRDVPNYTQAVGNSLEKGAAAPAAGTSVSLADCQTAALYGGSGIENCGAAPAFKGIQQWFNTADGKPVTLASLKGKVVIVDFWAYSCINCQRELPHVEAWYKDYAADGLEVVGVQTPEYAFEHVPSNVLAGARRLGLTFPVALDDSYDTWNAYDNQSSQAAYLIDATGKIRFVSIGEGDYTQEEQIVRQLLLAAHPGVALPKATNVANTTPTDPNLSPETYLGADRAQYYDGNYYSSDTFAFPAALPAHSYGLSGPGRSASSRSPQARTPRSGCPTTRPPCTSTSAAAAPSRSPRAARRKVIRVSGAPDIYTVAREPGPRGMARSRSRCRRV